MDNKELHMHNSKILEGNLLDILPTLPDNHFDAVLCDPPYHLTQNSRGGSARKCSRQPGDGGTTPYGRHRVGTDTSTGTGFMGQTWDGGDIAFRPETWEAVLRVMKPGGYLMAFGGSRTFHRLAVALEDAGFVLVDTLMWLFGSGFPKSHDVSKAIDRKLGHDRKVIGTIRHPTLQNTTMADASANAAHGSNAWRREWNFTLPACQESQSFCGYGTALKPAFEPVLLCRKPGEKTYAENALKWGCGALNIDGARIPVGDSEPNGRPLREIRPDPQKNGNVYAGRQTAGGGFDGGSRAIGETSEGRWPANVLLDEEAARLLDAQSGIRKSGAMRAGTLRGIGNLHVYGKAAGAATVRDIPPSAGGASRFFYVSKVSTKERQAGVAHGNHHPTLKPIDLARQLATLLLPPARHDGLPRRLLVPFSGAGSEMIGGLLAGWDEVIGIEQSPEYAEIARKRIEWWMVENSIESVDEME